ncbi:MAG: type II secretion system minor pseudopilin GspH [Gammaproteobacteria bacterium]|nr:type II secretion system minor pseudopilin GspH [Gammaproteobacteria bacterium]
MSPRLQGFTLIEVLVVIVIIGIIASIAVLSLGALGRDPPAQQAAERLAALIDLAAQQAVMQGQQYGLLVNAHAYEFMRYDGTHWSPVTDDTTFRARELGNEVTLQLQLEGTPIVLPPTTAGLQDADAKLTQNASKAEVRPQIALLSSGELTPFEIMISGNGKHHQYTVKGSLLHGIQLLPADSAAMQ